LSSYPTPYLTYSTSLSLHDALPIFLVIFAEALVRQRDHAVERAGGPRIPHCLDADIFVIAGVIHLVELVAAAEFGPDRVPQELRSEEHTSELQSRFDLVCRLLLEKK